MGIAQIIVQDFGYGVYDSIVGVTFIKRLYEEDAKEVVVVEERREPREKTVMEMRRERMGIVRRQRSPPQKKDSFLMKLSKIYGMNLAFLVTWQMCILILSIIFGLFQKPEWGHTLGYVMFVPLFLITRGIQSLWFSDIAGLCMRAINKGPTQRLGATECLEESVKSIVHQTFFLIQGIFSCYLPIPIITPYIVFIHAALLNSMYSFDYLFDSFHKRSVIRRFYFDSHWPYFIGFGTPLALACSVTDNMFLKGVIFSICFPLFIISSFKGNWVRKYDEEIPRIAFCKIASMFTKVVMDNFKRLTTIPPPVPPPAPRRMQ